MPGETDAEGEPPLAPRRARRMTRTHAVLWTVILAATAADIVLTMTGLANGLREGNVVLHALVSEFGPAGLWGLKFAAMVWLVAGWTLLSDRNAAIFLALFALVTVAVVLNNAVLVAGL